ncbi:MAG: flippase-like domain-containing protein [Pirellulales bacterium]|nr:flippase-like domain-containing protein [Pirellulales bacterium]
MQRTVVTALKFAVSLCVVGWLIWLARDDVPELLRQKKHWHLLATAMSVILAMVVATFVRWWLLVRALGMDFRLRDALRLGFVGFLFNFVSLGSVGGDLFKAVFIAREQPGRRAEAVASVVIDRVIGLYGLFVVATAAVLWESSYASDHHGVRVLSQLVLLGTGIGGVGILLILIPGFTHGRMSRALSRLPHVGALIGQLLRAIRQFRARMGTVALALAISIFVHCGTTCGFFWIAGGLSLPSPSLPQHFLVVPLTLLANAVPLPMGGLGAGEFALDALYQQTAQISEGSGLIVVLGYRVITIFVAITGVAYYLANRTFMNRVLEDESEIESLEHSLDEDRSRNEFVGNEVSGAS